MVQIELNKMVSVDESDVLVSSKLFVDLDAGIKYMTNMVIGAIGFSVNAEECKAICNDVIRECSISSPKYTVELNWEAECSNKFILAVKFIGDITSNNEIHSCWKDGRNILDIFPTHYDALNAEFQTYIAHIRAQYECVDSLRIGLVSSIDSMSCYDKIKSCCGQDDSILEIHGISYMLGCNYDH